MDTALPALMPSGNLGSWLVPVVSHFSTNNIYLCDAEIVPLFSDFCILPDEATSYRFHKQSGGSFFIAKKNSLQR